MKNIKYLFAGLGAVGSMFVIPRIMKPRAAVLAGFDVTWCNTVRATITVKNTGTKDLHLKWRIRYVGPASYTDGWWDIGTLAPGQEVTAPVDDTHISDRTSWPIGTYDAIAEVADWDTGEIYDTETISAAFRVVEIAKAEITSFNVVKV